MKNKEYVHAQLNMIALYVNEHVQKYVHVLNVNGLLMNMCKNMKSGM